MDDMSIRDSRELNLQTHRAPASVWDRRGWESAPTRMAVTRLLLGAAGGALAIQGLRQKSKAGGLMTSMGSALMLWAISEGGDWPRVQRWCADLVGRLRQADDADLDASADSFPASDPPSRTATVGTGLRRAPASR
jgi:hypothetical protein